MCLYERQLVAAATFVITVTACSPQYSSQAQIMTACHQPTVFNMAARSLLLPYVQKTHCIKDALHNSWHKSLTTV